MSTLEELQGATPKTVVVVATISVSPRIQRLSKILVLEEKERQLTCMVQSTGLWDMYHRLTYIDDVSCAVCYVAERNTVLMIPGKYTCPED